MFSKIALESLVQRGRSALYNDLISLYQKAQVALKDAKNASNKEIIKILKSIKFSDHFDAIIKKHTGLPFLGVKINENSNPDFYCSIRKNENYDPEKPRFTRKGALLSKINDHYNDRKGRLIDSIPVSKSPFHFIVFMNSGIFKVRELDGSFTFLPEEIAALILHEIGHVDLWIRIGRRAQQRLNDTSDMIDYIETEPPKENILSLIENLSQHKNIRQEWGDVLQVISSSVSSSEKIDSDYKEALSALSIVVVSDAAGAEVKILQAPQSIDYQRRKTTIFSVDEERSADEYSTRHGSTGPLISALTKLDRLESSDTERYINQVLGSDLPIILTMFFKFYAKFNTRPEVMSGGYDSLLRRLELIIETAKHAFHDDKLPPEAARQIKEDILQAEKYLDDYRKADYRKARQSLLQWKENVKKFGRIISLPFSNRLDKDYAKLQDANRSLGKHSLYYLAKK